MKRSFLWLTPCFVVASLVIAPTASANEFVVGGQVLSDTVAAPGTTADSYVGDISPDQAGCYGGEGCNQRQYGRPDLFYNYYTQGYCNRANAQMYLSPLPVPPNVGHTFLTYQPLYPHHFMFKHRDTYHNYYDNGRGTNRTRVSYSYPPIRTAVQNLYWNYIRLPR